MTKQAFHVFSCPRCDASLDATDSGHFCAACDVSFPSIGGIPWLFSEPDASLQEWRNRLHMAIQQLSQDIASLEVELKRKELRALSRRRMERYHAALREHQKKLKTIAEPLLDAPMTASLESYLALRTRLPTDQGLNTYYANVHRDWVWGDEENAASLNEIRGVLHDNASLGRVLVLGSGAGRLAYDIASELDCDSVVALDFNPLLMFVADAMFKGEKLKLYEFPIAPKSLEDDAVVRSLKAPAPAGNELSLVFADALRPPFAKHSFDTVITPWLIDIISEDLPVFAARINQLLKEHGRWVNFGSLAFNHPKKSRNYSPEEVKAIVAEAGFSDPYVRQSTIPYMCSPASRHGRQERVFTFSAWKERAVKAPPRHKALPDWLVTGKGAVPQTQSFRTQAMTTQVYAFIMSLIDGRRSIEDMAKVLEKQQLMSRDEAFVAIRTFLTKMHDDAQRASGF